MNEADVIRDKDGNIRPDHSHTIDFDFWDGPFTLAKHFTSEEPCDDYECFGELPGGARDIRTVLEQ